MPVRTTAVSGRSVVVQAVSSTRAVVLALPNRARTVRYLAGVRRVLEGLRQYTMELKQCLTGQDFTEKAGSREVTVTIKKYTNSEAAVGRTNMEVWQDRSRTVVNQSDFAGSAGFARSRTIAVGVGVEVRKQHFTILAKVCQVLPKMRIGVEILVSERPLGRIVVELWRTNQFYKKCGI